MSAEKPSAERPADSQLQAAIQQLDLDLQDAAKYLAEQFTSGRIHVSPHQLEKGLKLEDPYPLIEMLQNEGLLREMTGDGVTAKYHGPLYQITFEAVKFVRKSRPDLIASWEDFARRHRYLAPAVIVYVVLQAALQLILAGFALFDYVLSS